MLINNKSLIKTINKLNLTDDEREKFNKISEDDRGNFLYNGKPVTGGATEAQAAQIEANRTAIGDSNSGLVKEVNNIKNTELQNLNTAILGINETLGDKTGLPSGDANVIASINRIDRKTTTGNGLTSEQAQQLTTAYEHSQTTHVQASDIPSLNGYATETYADNAVSTALDGHTFKFLTQSEYDSLSDDEKNNESIVYNITDSIQDSYSLSYENNTLSLNNNDVPISSVTIGNSSSSVADPALYQTKTEINDYKGCVYNAMGDSITAENEYTSKNYHQYVKDNLGLLAVNNYGVDRNTITKETRDDNTAMCVRYSEMADADIITVAGGVNDMGLNRTIGTIDNLNDEDGLTFYSALRILIEGLINKYPNKLIIFITPANIGANTFFNEPNSQGKYVRDYANAIKEVCEIYGIPVFDNNTTSGVYPKIDIHKTTWTRDGLHWNDEYHKKVGKKLSNFIKYHC